MDYIFVLIVRYNARASLHFDGLRPSFMAYVPVYMYAITKKGLDLNEFI